MNYTKPSFSVPAVGLPPVDCQHGWLDKRGKCVLCGNHEPPKPESVTTVTVGVDHHGRKRVHTHRSITGLAKR